MSRLSQIKHSMSRSMRIFLRDKTIFGSSVFIPLFFLFILPLVMFQDVPSAIMPSIKAYLVIAMVILLATSTGVSNFAGSIAGDRDHGLYSKLSSMPVSPINESIGRIITVLVFSSMGSILLVSLGILYGAELSTSAIDLILVVGIGFIVCIGASGIGLIVACFVKSESAAAHVGLAIVLANYFIGIAVPFADLPEALKPVARISPFSSGNSMIASRILGTDFIGYDPWNFLDLGLLVAFSFMLLAVGLVLYSKLCWRK
ncbi:MAG: ABC transporter permease [Candidatus Thorarchaeota archaeon]|nr:ABC transporter permease [Candidatus Thorarchaeota archaeon]